MKDSSVKFDHQFCERLNQEYRKLHNNNYAMLGDLKYFFYFTPQNFELYEILSAISNDAYGHGDLVEYLGRTEKQ